MRVNDHALPRDSAQRRFEAAFGQPMGDRDRSDRVAASTDAEDERTARIRYSGGKGEQG